MGVVYAVHDGSRNEPIALKTLRRARPADVSRLKREFRSLADIAHPNVVCLYELWWSRHIASSQWSWCMASRCWTTSARLVRTRA